MQIMRLDVLTHDDVVEMARVDAESRDQMVCPFPVGSRDRATYEHHFTARRIELETVEG